MAMNLAALHGTGRQAAVAACRAGCWGREQGNGSRQLRPLLPAQAPRQPATHRCAGGGGRSWRACRRAGRGWAGVRAGCASKGQRA